MSLIGTNAGCVFDAAAEVEQSTTGIDDVINQRRRHLHVWLRATATISLFTETQISL